MASNSLKILTYCRFMRKGLIVYRAPEFLSSRPHWVTPPPPLQGSGPPPPQDPSGGGGGGTQFWRLDRNPDILYTLWDYAYLLIALFYTGKRKLADKTIFPYSAIDTNFEVPQLSLGSTFKGTVAWDVFFSLICILSRIERKDLKFFSCCAYIYWIRAGLNSFGA